ncbi:TolC family protein [Puia sp. P3]|uniref:TolC family protein n=1 Tax=Puia sp. P3 TaxID=3423952 RepID=UPI003D676F11
MLTRILHPAIFVLSLSSSTTAQTAPAPLTIGEAVSAALSNNSTLKIASLEEQAAASRYKETEAVLLPQVGISYSAMTTNNPLNAFGFKLQQKTIEQADFDPAKLDHPGATPDFMTSLDIRQPLLNMDRLYQRKGAYAEMEVYRLRTRRTSEEVVFQTRKAYLQLQLANRSQKVMEDALFTALALYHYTTDRVGQGMLSRSDALNVQVQVSAMESRLADTRSQVRDASDYLGLLMGWPSGLIYSIDSSSGDNGIADVNPATVTASGEVLIPGNRADLAAMRKAVEGSDWMLRSSKMSALPRVNAFGSYQFNDSRFPGFGTGAWLAGIRLSWDLFKGNSVRNRNTTLSLEKQRLSEEYALYKKQSIIELNSTLRKLTDAQFRIGQQRAAVAAAKESYRILHDRYEQGLSGSTDILLAQTQLSQQQLALSQAVFDQEVTRAYLDYLTSTSAK